jgi:ATP-dependent DNA helicase RecQ
LQPTPEHILKQYWGHADLRHTQKEIIETVLSGKDCLALLPTGGGKSVCFQVPALMMEGICIVISPLIALMEDQVAQLKKKNIRAEAIHSGLKYSEIDILLDNCVYGDIKLLYVSPERVQTEIFKERLKKMKVSFVAVDEAHCISQWGYDFRPSYLKIVTLREEKPALSFLALTASATAEVKQDIIEKLELRSASVFQRSFARPNISFAVRQTENKEKKTLEILSKIQGTAIVYVRSRKSTRDVALWLTKNKITATYYHAGLEYEERKKRQEAWQKNQIRVMVATNAFGMGINKDDVRTVIHLDLPENLESYYQEAGRAGRDGKRAYAVMIFHQSDISTLESKVNQSQPNLEYLKKVYQGLANYFQLAENAGQFESFDFNLEDFCTRFNMRSGNAYPALKKLEEAALIEFSESFYSPSKVHILMDKLKLYEFQVANARFDPIIQALLRLYGAELLSSLVVISETSIAKALKLPETDIRTLLQQLNQLKILSYWPASNKPQITFLTPRYDADKIPIDVAFLNERRKLIFSKMNAMTDFVSQNHQCRQWVMLDYFDEKNYDTCGVCDVCLARKKKENLAELKDYRAQVMYLLKSKPMTVDELETEVKPNDRELMLEVVRELVDENKINYDEYWVLRKTSSK